LTNTAARPAPNSERERIWQPNASLKREIEVRFIAECKDATRVELEHQHLDRYGARRDEMRDLIEGRRNSMRAGSAIPKVRRSVGGWRKALLRRRKVVAGWNDQASSGFQIGALS
jgi:hypothetical protein